MIFSCLHNNHESCDCLDSSSSRPSLFAATDYECDERVLRRVPAVVRQCLHSVHRARARARVLWAANGVLKLNPAAVESKDQRTAAARGS